MPKLLRMENVHDPMCGPYDSRICKLMDRVKNSWGNLPGPYSDRGIDRMIHIHEVCATRSPRQFGLWWPQHALMALTKSMYSNLRVVIVQAPDEHVQHGRYQSLVNRGAAKVLHSFTVREWALKPMQEREALLNS